jgi:hypothetical protein
MSGVLVVNGRKINSFALSLEASYFYHLNNYNVKFLNLNIYNNIFSKSVRFRNKVLKENFIEQIPLANRFLQSFHCANLALLWYLNARKSEKPWSYRLQTMNLETGELVRSLIARTMGSSNFSLLNCSRSQVLDIVFKLFLSYHRTISAIERFPGLLELGIAHGGRDSFSAGAVAAFREKKIPVRLIESGGVTTNWSNFEKSPHYSPNFWSRLREVEDVNCGADNVDEWWAERLRGSDHFRGEEWSGSRTLGHLPSELPSVFITFFTTSEFEIPVFKDFDVFPGKYKNQFEALSNLYKLTSELDIHLVVRRHPNSVDWQGMDRESKLWDGFKSLSNLTYIGPKEKIDSIELAKRSKQVFTFKSSVGIEAIWLGVSAFAMGPARWAWTDELRAWDENRLKDIILNSPKNNNQHAIRWAQMMLTMDCPNKIFTSIAGNYAHTIGETYVITRFDELIEAITLKLLFFTQNCIHLFKSLLKNKVLYIQKIK